MALSSESEEMPSGTFWMGQKTLRIPMSLHAENRARLVASMRGAAGGDEGGVVLLQGGEQQSRNCTDHEPLFRQESYFAYLFGVSEAGFYGAVDLRTGRSYLFIPRLPEAYAVWMGAIHKPEFFQKKYQVDAVHYIEEMPEVLAGLGGGAGVAAPAEGGEAEGKGSGAAGTGSKPTLYVLYGLNSDSGSYCKPATFEGIDAFPVDKKALHPVLNECRVHKSAAEIEVLRYAGRVSSEAHVEVMRSIRPGMMEYQLESLFQHHTYSQAGCRHCGYACICATGESGAVLHYGHAGAPNDRQLRDGDMALLDMGAEYHCYGADITCSYPVNGKFTEQQRVVYGAVLAAQKAVIAAMKPGVSWVDMHRLAERSMLEKLRDGGVLQGSVDEMMKAHLGAVLMPHGLGHFLGIDTHDVGGYPEGTNRVDEPGLRSLRTVRTLEEGMVITVEPGCYFIEAVLAPALADEERARFFVRPAIEALRGSGGVRLEDDLVVTADGCENLTLCPREVEDVEAVMAGAPWPPVV